MAARTTLPVGTSTVRLRGRLADRRGDPGETDRQADGLERAGNLPAQEADGHRDRDPHRRDRRHDAHGPHRHRPVEEADRDRPGGSGRGGDAGLAGGQVAAEEEGEGADQDEPGRIGDRERRRGPGSAGSAAHRGSRRPPRRGWTRDRGRRRSADRHGCGLSRRGREGRRRSAGPCRWPPRPTVPTGSGAGGSSGATPAGGRGADGRDGTPGACGRTRRRRCRLLRCQPPPVAPPPVAPPPVASPVPPPPPVPPRSSGRVGGERSATGRVRSARGAAGGRRRGNGTEVGGGPDCCTEIPSVSASGPVARALMPKGRPPTPPLKPISAATRTGTASSTATTKLLAAIRRRHSCASVSCIATRR